MKNYELENEVVREEDQEVEGYEKCQSADRRCEQDCFGSGFWTCDN